MLISFFLCGRKTARTKEIETIPVVLHSSPTVDVSRPGRVTGSGQEVLSARIYQLPKSRPSMTQQEEVLRISFSPRRGRPAPCKLQVISSPTGAVVVVEEEGERNVGIQRTCLYYHSCHAATRLAGRDRSIDHVYMHCFTTQKLRIQGFAAIYTLSALRWQARRENMLSSRVVYHRDRMGDESGIP